LTHKTLQLTEKSLIFGENTEGVVSN
jgi:hypothetical protein